MTKIDTQIDQVAKTIMEIARSKGFVDLPSPADIEYGFGCEPTLSFWYGQRRIHLSWPKTSSLAKAESYASR